MKIEVSIGEIVDKLSILKIKTDFIKDEEKLNNVKKEYDYLYDIVFNEMKIEQSDFFDMVSINQKLWKIEDDIRNKERNKTFDDEFIELSRSVYFTNDEITKRTTIYV
jgi:hypothetical protein